MFRPSSRTRAVVRPLPNSDYGEYDPDDPYDHDDHPKLIGICVGSSIACCACWVLILIVIVAAAQRDFFSEVRWVALVLLCFCCCLGCLTGIAYWCTAFEPDLATSSFEPNIGRGIKYTLCNYWIPQMFYAQLASLNDTATSLYYRCLARYSPIIGEGPGPDTHTFYSWNDCKAIFANWHPRTMNRTMTRGNELGAGMMNSEIFEDTGRIALGYSQTDHAAVRPILGRSLDGARLSEKVVCDGSEGWNSRWLRTCFRDRFANVDSFATDDIVWWVTVILHKVHANVDLGEDEAKDFSSKMTRGATYAFMPAGFIGCPIIHALSGVKGFNASKAEHMEMLRQALVRKFPQEPWDPRKLTLTASAVMDSLMFAGGLSVPTTIKFMLGLMHKSRSVASLESANFFQEQTLRDFMLETLRRYAPVGSVPRWITNDGGETWEHELACIEQAMKDPTVFPEPLEFVLGRPGLNALDCSRSLNWADPLLVNNDVCHPDSHACPGKILSQEIIIAFFMEFMQAGPWEAKPDCVSCPPSAPSCCSIRNINMSPSSFSLVKVNYSSDSADERYSGSYTGLSQTPDH